MLYQITDGTVTAGGVPVLSHIDFEIHGNEKIAVVGRNGAGKTTLLRLIAGELDLDRDDRRSAPGVSTSRKVTIGMLKQQAFSDGSHTVEEELLTSCPGRDTYERERFEYEREYDTLFTGFGFAKEDKRKKLSEFSGGEQTKIALIGLLLLKPDILLLDEPTNHLDIKTTEWLEQYMRSYEKAVVMVSHDRFFLDRSVDVVYELAGGKLVRYPGDYTNYREQKVKRLQSQKKAYERQQEEIARLEALVERFKHKPNKAAFARAKRKNIERIERILKPEDDDVSMFPEEIQPLIQGSKWVFESEHLKIGYEQMLLEITIRIRRGQKIGILGSNGVGKTTFLKTVAGLIPPIDGIYSLGVNTTIGYFDQFSAASLPDDRDAVLTVADHFHNLFPILTEKEVRSTLGAYLFGGKEAGKRVASLSGGERARLILAELLQSRPNLMVLDEPTNHMDIQAKETLESAFCAYKGTILFVSHDRYFIKQVADAVLIFENQSVMYYPFGYDHYLEHCYKQDQEGTVSAQVKAEDQALIAGMRAVPKAERHRLREISTEDAYGDWKKRLAGEQVDAALAEVETLEARMERMKSEWLESESYWNGGVWDQEEKFARIKAQYEQAWAEWHIQCVEWYDNLNGEGFLLPEIAECEKG